VPNARQLLNTASNLIEPIRKTIGLGIQPVATGDNRQGDGMKNGVTALRSFASCIQYSFEIHNSLQCTDNFHSYMGA